MIFLHTRTIDGLEFFCVQTSSSDGSCVTCFSNVKQLREQYQDAFVKKHNMKLGFMSAFVKATAYALQDMPVVNAVIDENDIVYRDYIDISVAVATPKVMSLGDSHDVKHSLALRTCSILKVVMYLVY